MHYHNVTGLKLLQHYTFTCFINFQQQIDQTAQIVNQNLLAMNENINNRKNTNLKCISSVLKNEPSAPKFPPTTNLTFIQSELTLLKQV